jgi:hypothetical protein
MTKYTSTKQGRQKGHWFAALVGVVLFAGVLFSVGPAVATHSDFGAEASTWQQVSGNATTTTTLGGVTCLTGTTPGAGYYGNCGTVALQATVPYYFVCGVQDTSPASEGACYGMSAATGGTIFGIMPDGVLFGIDADYAVHLVYHRNVTADKFYAIVRVVPNIAVADAGIGRSGQADELNLRDWTLSGTTGLKLSSGSGGVTVGYIFSTGEAAPLTGLVAQAGNESIRLGWSASSGADYYLVWADDSSHACANVAVNYDLVGNTTLTSFTHTGLTNGVPRYYCVRPVNGTTFLGDYSSEVSATPWLAPHLVANLGAGAAELAWDTGGYSDISNFTLYRGASVASLAPLVSLLPEARGYNDPLGQGQAFYYAVKVTNATNTSAWSNSERVAMPTFFNWSGNLTRLVPDPVHVFINRTFQETYWVDAVRFDAHGVPRSIMTAAPWNASSAANFTFRWPQFRPSNASLDAPAVYHLFVTDGEGGYLDGRNFCIGTNWTLPVPAFFNVNMSSCLSAMALDDGSKSKLAVDSATEAAAVSQALESAEVTQTSQSLVKNGLDFFLGQPLGFPTMLILDIAGLLLVVVAVVLGRRG